MRANVRIPRAARKTNETASESGVTLIELVVVIAIIGILIAITVPTIRGFLENARRQAHEADRRTIQVAVDAYYTSTSNDPYQGQRQYPIMGKRKDAGTSGAWGRSEKCEGQDEVKPILSFLEPDSLERRPVSHPLRGIRGGTPRWQEGTGDAADGIRNQAEPQNQTEPPEVEAVYCPPELVSSSPPVSPTGDGEDGGRKDHWLSDYVSLDRSFNCDKEARGGTASTTSGEGNGQAATPDRCRVIDSRDYLIDFCELIDSEFIEEFPRSASLDHDRGCLDAGGGALVTAVVDPAAATPEDAADPPEEENPPGSYTWYVDEVGKVQSLYYYFPTSSDPDNRGYFSGVYP